MSVESEVAQTDSTSKHVDSSSHSPTLSRLNIEKNSSTTTDHPLTPRPSSPSSPHPVQQPQQPPTPQLALRSFLKGVAVGYGGYAVLNLVFLRMKIFSKDGLRQLLFSQDAVRAALSIGGFCGIYKLCCYLLNQWRQRFIDQSPGRRLKDGQIEEHSQRPLHQIISGAVAGGVALLLQRHENRKIIALYLFTRLLQCAYNDTKARGLWQHSALTRWVQENGGALLFILACGQVIYAYVMHPETLPPSYLKFVSKSGPIDDRTLDAVRTICRGGKEPVNMASIMQFCTEKSRGRITVNPLKTPYPFIVPCPAIHPQNESCLRQIFDTTLSSAQKALPLYGILTFAPLLLFNFGSILRSPFYTFIKAALGTLRSASFLGALVGLLQVWTCGHRNFFNKDHKLVYYLGGLFCSTAILIEKKNRRAELALFVFPRALSSLYAQLGKRRLVPNLPYGEVLLFCMTMGGLMYYHQNAPATMAPTLTRMLTWFLQ